MQADVKGTAGERRRPFEDGGFRLVLEVLSVAKIERPHGRSDAGNRVVKRGVELGSMLDGGQSDSRVGHLHHEYVVMGAAFGRTDLP